MSLGAEDIVHYRRRVDRDLRMAMKAMATGRAVSDASDNPTYWAIARETRSDQEVVDVVNTALDFALVKLGATEAALTGVHDGIVRIQSLLTLGLEPGADRARLGLEIDALRESIRTMIQSASVNGLNYMVANVPTASGYNAYPAQELTASVTRGAGGAITLRTLNFSGKELVMLSTDAATAGRFSTVGYLTAIAQPAASPYPYMYYQLVGLASHYWVNARDITLTASTPAAHIEEMVSALESVRSKVALALTDLGLATGSVEVQRKLNEKIAIRLDREVSALVDADMSEVAARVKALEVRRALSAALLPLLQHEPEALLLLRA